MSRDTESFLRMPSRSGADPRRRRLAPLPLIGREREFRQLSAVLQPGRALWVSGPAGVGKTALVRAWAAAAEPPGSVLYVAESRTLGAIARCLGMVQDKRARRRIGASPSARARSGTDGSKRHPLHGVRVVVLDHVDVPGPRLNELLAQWRERVGVVLVARSWATLARLNRQLFDYDTIELRPVGAAAAMRILMETCPAPHKIGLAARDLEKLVRLAHGLPGILVGALREAARGSGCSVERLVLEARVKAVGHERDAIVRANLRSAARQRSRFSRDKSSE